MPDLSYLECVLIVVARSAASSYQEYTAISQDNGRVMNRLDLYHSVKLVSCPITQQMKVW